MKKTVVLFKPRTYPKDSYRDKATPVHMPLSLLSIASPLIREGYNVVLLDEHFDGDIEKKMAALKDDTIAMGTTGQTGYELVGGLRISKYAKEVLGIPTIWGGWHASTTPRQTVENFYVDFVVKGSGLQTLIDLVTAINNKSPFENVPSILYKENGVVFENADRKLVDMNDYPMPAYDIVDLERYIEDGCGKGMGISNSVHHSRDRMIMYSTSYGCPFRCRYCATTTVYGRQVTMLQAERVVEELDYLVKKYNIRTIFFVDANFFTNTERVKKICQGIIAGKLNIKFTVAPRVDQIMRWDDEVLSLLKKSGCIWLGVGSESGSQNILNYMNKDIKASDIMEAARKVRKADIDVGFYFMFGMPANETRKDLYDSFQLAAQLKELYPEVLLPMYFYDPYPRTPIYDDALKRGFKEPRSLEEWSKYVPDVRDKNEATPYISRSYVDFVKRVIIFYLPLAYPADMVRGTLTNIKSRMRKGRDKYLLRILHVLAKFRAKRQFYSFPLEWMLFKLFQRLRLRKQEGIYKT